MPADIHHLVYTSPFSLKPVACGSTYDDAQSHAEYLGLERPEIRLLVSGPRALFDARIRLTLCPICKS